MLIPPVLVTISSARLNRLRGWKEASTLRKRFPPTKHMVPPSPTKFNLSVFFRWTFATIQALRTLGDNFGMSPELEL